MEQAKMKTVFIPESPTMPGLYAAKAPQSLGKIGEKGTDYSTLSVEHALQFAGRGECQDWCDEWNATAKRQGYSGRFQPVEHEFPDA